MYRNFFYISMSQETIGNFQDRRSKRTKAMDLNRSHYDGDPSHREFSLRVPTVSRSASVEQLVSQFDHESRGGAVPKKNVDVRMDSIADQIRDCSIGYDFEVSNNKERTEVDAVLRNP